MLRSFLDRRDDGDSTERIIARRTTCTAVHIGDSFFKFTTDVYLFKLSLSRMCNPTDYTMTFPFSFLVLIVSLLVYLPRTLASDCELFPLYSFILRAGASALFTPLEDTLLYAYSVLPCTCLDFFPPARRIHLVPVPLLSECCPLRELPGFVCLRDSANRTQNSLTLVTGLIAESTLPGHI